MASDGTVTLWLNLVRTGEHEKARDQLSLIWQRYFARMAALADKRLRGQPAGPADGEDVALSAFDHFYRRAEKGELPEVADHEDLWRLLMGITAWKARDQVRREARLKRGGGRVAEEAHLDDPSGPAAERLIEQLSDDEEEKETPDVQAALAEQLPRLLGLLEREDPVLRLVAEWKLQGDDNGQIQAKLGRSPRTVERKLQRIRDLWKPEMSR